MRVMSCMRHGQETWRSPKEASVPEGELNGPATGMAGTFAKRQG
jgi:hypothetical protein